MCIRDSHFPDYPFLPHQPGDDPYADPSSAAWASPVQDSIWLPVNNFNLAPSHARLPPPAVHALRFDPSREAFWAADSQGKLSCFLSPSLAKVASFAAHPSAVVDFHVQDDAVVSVSDGALRCHSSGGLLLAECAGELQGLSCVLAPARSSAAFLIGSSHNSVLGYDLHRNLILQEAPLAQGVSCAQRSMRGICLGGSLGDVYICDDRSLRVEHTLSAHASPVNAIDIKGDLLVTCGVSKTSKNNQTFLEPQLKVFDLRMKRALRALPFHGGSTPQFLKFHPRFSSTVIAVSPLGHLQLVDVQEELHSAASTRSAFQLVTTLADPITAFDLSSTSEAIAFGGQGGSVCLWGDSADLRINYRSSSFELPLFGAPPPQASIVGDYPYVPLSRALTPPMFHALYHPAHGKPARSTQSDLFSNFWIDPDLPLLEVGLLPNDRLLRDISSSLKITDFVGYAPNTHQRPRNLVQRSPYSDPSQPHHHAAYEDASQPSELLAEENEPLRSMSEPNLPLHTMAPPKKRPPEKYRFFLSRHHHGAGVGAASAVPAKSPSRGAKKINFTTLTALTNTLPNSYINPLLYCLYFLPSFRAHYLNHLCTKTNCFSCETAFLFHILDVSGGGAVESSNLLRTFQRLGRAKQMGLIVTQNPPPLAKSKFSCFIERAMKFLLQQYHSEHLTNTPHPLYPTQPPNNSPDIIQTMFGYEQALEQTCQVCSTKVTSNPLLFWVDLVYPPFRHPKPPFATTLKRSLDRNFTHRRWCEQCSAYQDVAIHQAHKSLPNAFCINANVDTEDALQFWKPASHESSSGGSFWLPTRLRFVLSGQETLIEECSESATGANIYELVAVVAQISDQNNHGDLSHYVSFINVRNSYFAVAPKRDLPRHQKSSDAGWYLMNDGSIFPVNESEVLSFEQPWKTPSILLFARVNILQALPPAPRVNPITDDVWKLADPYLDHRPPQYHQLERSFLLPEHLPVQGELVAIDIECVVNSHLLPLDEGYSSFQIGHFSLARVSVIQERHEHGKPILDDYIEAQEETENYLTRFSGIEEGDLDPKVSAHHVLPLKHCYVKLRNLVDRGAVFVGHGLQQDLQIMNLYVRPSQIIDTVGLFRLKHQRNIKLAFLTSFLIGSSIQEHTHCSIEDARSALQVYRKYQQLLAENKLTDVVHELYRVGNLNNWTLDFAESKSNE